MKLNTSRNVLSFFNKREYPITIKKLLPKYNRFFYFYGYLNSREAIRIHSKQHTWTASSFTWSKFEYKKYNYMILRDNSSTPILLRFRCTDDFDFTHRTTSMYHRLLAPIGLGGETEAGRTFPLHILTERDRHARDDEKYYYCAYEIILHLYFFLNKKKFRGFSESRWFLCVIWSCKPLDSIFPGLVRAYLSVSEERSGITHSFQPLIYTKICMSPLRRLSSQYMFRGSNTRGFDSIWYLH